MRTVNVRPWLARTDAAVAASTARLEQARERFRQDTDEFARDRQRYQQSLALLARGSPPSRDVAGRVGRREADGGRE